MKINICSNRVPIEKTLIEFAADEKECQSVGTVLVFYTGGAIGKQKIPENQKQLPHFLASYINQFPMFNDKKFVKRYELQISSASKNNKKDISCSPSDANLLPTFSPSTVSISIAMPFTHENRRIIFKIIEYKGVTDSSSFGMDKWINLAKDIEMWYEHFDGFVVLHGTDTLPYAASGLSFILENLSKPIVITGTEIPIDELRSDGRQNLLRALMFAGGSYGIAEVTVLSKKYLYRGNRVVKGTTCGEDAFISPNFPAIGELTSDINIFHDRILKSGDAKRTLRVHPDLCPNVAILRLFPSITAETVRPFFQPPIQGVILQSYGAGNVPSNYTELIDIFREAATKHKIIILNTTQCWRGGVTGVYATGAILNTIGAISGRDITPEAALMKMAYVLGKWSDPLTRKRMLIRNLRGEMLEEMMTTIEHSKVTPTLPSTLSSVSLEHTQMLGEMLVSADNNGFSSLWSQNIFRSLMCSASEADDTETLEQLYRIAGHFEWFDHSRRSLLHLAASAGSFASCRLLLEYGANPNIEDKSGMTMLSCAIRSNNSTPALIKMIMRYGGHLSGFSSAQAREANNAARLGRIRQLRLYVLAGLNLQELDSEGRAPLHTAVVYHQVETVRYLVMPSEHSSKSLLYEAAEITGFEIGGAGVDPNQLTGYGTTALKEAEQRNFTDIVQILEPLKLS